jgi:hypothetical protein
MSLFKINKDHYFSKVFFILMNCIDYIYWTRDLNEHI